MERAKAETATETLSPVAASLWRKSLLTGCVLAACLVLLGVLTIL
jgi:hypothetical protein